MQDGARIDGVSQLNRCFNLRIESLVIESLIDRYIPKLSDRFNLRIESLVIERASIGAQPKSRRMCVSISELRVLLLRGIRHD